MKRVADGVVTTDHALDTCRIDDGLAPGSFGLGQRSDDHKLLRWDQNPRPTGVRMGTGVTAGVVLKESASWKGSTHERTGL